MPKLYAVGDVRGSGGVDIPLSTDYIEPARL